MNNPFVYGEVVPASAFVDREAELDRLVSDLRDGQKVFLISPRRYGKSSLVRQALRSAARGGALRGCRRSGRSGRRARRGSCGCRAGRGLRQCLRYGDARRSQSL
jgi:AAA+ ATPase superfamily predicted ATPase